MVLKLDQKCKKQRRKTVLSAEPVKDELTPRSSRWFELIDDVKRLWYVGWLLEQTEDKKLSDDSYSIFNGLRGVVIEQPCANALRADLG